MFLWLCIGVICQYLFGNVGFWHTEMSCTHVGAEMGKIYSYYLYLDGGKKKPFPALCRRWSQSLQVCPGYGALQESQGFSFPLHNVFPGLWYLDTCSNGYLSPHYPWGSVWYLVCSWKVLEAVRVPSGSCMKEALSCVTELCCLEQTCNTRKVMLWPLGWKRRCQQLMGMCCSW